MSRTAWTSIRRLRSAPPVLAKTEERRLTFAAALQQSEELFRAAAQAGPASRPLPLFYGLSQAGRAIAGAHNQDESWRIEGHGLSVELATGDIRETVIHRKPRKDGRDAITSVATALDAPALEGGMTLADLWASLPELRAHRLVAGAARRAIEIRPDGRNPNVLSALHPAQGTVYVTAKDEVGLAVVLDGYAGVEGYEVLVAPEVAVAELAQFTLHWAASPSTTATAGTKAIRTLREVAERVDDGWFLRPKLGDQAAPIPRLLRWWALLLGLSSLARYHPAEWVAALDVDSSPFAVDLEDGLRVALDEVPELVADSLGSISGLPHRFVNERLAQELGTSQGRPLPERP